MLIARHVQSAHVIPRVDEIRRIHVYRQVVAGEDLLRVDRANLISELNDLSIEALVGVRQAKSILHHFWLLKQFILDAEVVGRRSIVQQLILVHRVVSIGQHILLVDVHM